MPPGPKRHRWKREGRRTCPSCQTEVPFNKHEFAICEDCGTVRWQDRTETSNRGGRTLFIFLYVRKGSARVERQTPPCGDGLPPEDDEPMEIIPRFGRLTRD